MEVYAGNDFQLEPSTVCVLATVNNIFFLVVAAVS